MNSKNYKYMEHYRGNKILIYGLGREWWWEVVIQDKPKTSPASFFSVQTTLKDARKYIDKKVI